MDYANDSRILVSLVKNRYKSDEKIFRYVSYIDALVDRNLPPILTFQHLADYVGVDSKTLFQMSFRSNCFYSSFRIPKISGGFREISAPYETLDSIQRWIGEHILKSREASFLPGVIGYLRNKSILDHVTPHVGSECLIKLDIHKFFPSISANFVHGVFRSLGYNNSVSRTLAALLTVDGALPQGASTSPYLSNLRMERFDCNISQFCKERGLVYTRYVDDVVVSGGACLVGMATQLKQFLSNDGFTINETKTKLYSNRSDVRFITGLIISNGEIRLPKAMRRKIRVQSHLFLRDLPAMLLGVVKAAPESEESWRTKNRDFVYDPLFAERILGKLNYWLNIEPNNAYANATKKLILERLAAI